MICHLNSIYTYIEYIYIYILTILGNKYIIYYIIISIKNLCTKNEM